MRVENMLRKNKGTVAATTLVVVLLLPIAYYAIRDAFAQSPEQFLEKLLAWAKKHNPSQSSYQH